MEKRFLQTCFLKKKTINRYLLTKKGTFIIQKGIFYYHFFEDNFKLKIFLGIIWRKNAGPILVWWKRYLKSTFLKHKTYHFWWGIILSFAKRDQLSPPNHGPKFWWDSVCLWMCVCIGPCRDSIQEENDTLAKLRALYDL